MSQSKLLHFSGLYGDNQLAQKDFIHCESLELRSKVFDWEISEHFHTDLLQIFFIRKGRGQFITDKKKLEIGRANVLIIPANTLHGFHFFEHMDGEVLTVSQRFLENIFKANAHIFEGAILRRVISFETDLTIFNKLLNLYQEINEELINDKNEKYFAIKGLLELLFLQFFRSSFEEEKQEILANNRTLAYYQQFLKQIKQAVDQEKKVADYAESLKMSAVHLNRICRQVANKSALQVIQEIIILEAKNYLLNTNYTISEIAYFLNFNDPAYFNRLFRKLVGVPPGEFRKG